jgi:hypothetical protein
MLWGLADRYVDEVIELYRSREMAERALRKVLSEEPGWEGMMEVVPVPRNMRLQRTRPPWAPRTAATRRPRCRDF